MSKLDKEYESSLKSIETENAVDRAFYRPIGFRIAWALRNTGITPNEITILSIFVGAATGFLFYPENIWWNILGIVMLMLANILDCVDGQLARLTGIKSAIGRILDGMAGDVWFLCIYVCLSLRLANEYGTYWFFALALLSGFSHLFQANITDYYKTLHLYFISKEKGAEFQSPDEIEEKRQNMPKGISRIFYALYHGYSEVQVNATPQLQKMLKQMHAKYGDDIPEDIRLLFRKGSRQLMKMIDLMTFNGRTIVMFIVVLSGVVWLYFLYEIIVLNTVLYTCIKRHEKMCASFCDPK